MVVACLGCSGRVASPGANPPARPPAASDAAIADAAPKGVSEAEAREILNRAFRDAGLRVVNDLGWQKPAIDVTLDGYDPEREVGYEYVAEAERGTELDESELKELRNYPRILVLHPSSASAIREQAEEFLVTILAPDGGSE